MTWEQQRVSFGSNAAGYDDRRPDWPADTARWLTNTESGSGRENARLEVLDLGAGTGKLTETLAGLGHTVTAVEPDPDMRAVLGRKLPQVRALAGGAEQIPVPDQSIDVVTVAQAWHWFRQPEAALEVARVLRPGGLLAVGWHERDQRVPWVAELNRVAGLGEQRAAGAKVHAGDTRVELTEEFGPLEQATFEYQLPLTPARLAELAASWSYVNTRPDREQTLRQIQELGERVAAEQGNAGELSLPHVTQGHRARSLPV
jgi:ubiquinone/menaquinone biosynthesis C-methylase UbiE